MITTTPIVKSTRTFKGVTLSILPITDADCGIVKNGPATIWVKFEGHVGGSSFTPHKDELSAVKYLRYLAHKAIKLRNRTYKLG